MGNAGIQEGDLLFGKYRIERVIGTGGMGIVVAARHEQLDQLVAVKFIREDALGNPDVAQRFLQEARAAAKLKGEHVTRVLDVGMLESGVPYLIMEFLEGSDLAKILTESGPMPVTYALRLFRQACAALAEAHAAGIVHRDLKPQNLFLTRTPNGSPKLKVLDFGISKSSDGGGRAGHALTSATTVLGSPLYMAPEQIVSSRDVDARADVWSLGVVLFELLTGRCPFDADTYAALCVKIASGEPCRVSEFRQDVAPEVIAIIDRCLERDVEKRFANAEEVAAALDELPPDLLPPPSDVLGRSGRLSSSDGAAGALRASKSTPAAGWASPENRPATRSRALVVALLFSTVALGAGFVISRRWGARLAPAWQPGSAVHVPPAVAANALPEPRSVPAEIPPSSSEVATPLPPPAILADPAPAPAPSQHTPPTPLAAALVAATPPSLAPSGSVDVEGIPSRRTPPRKRSAPGSPRPAAATVAAPASVVAVDEGIPSRR